MHLRPKTKKRLLILLTTGVATCSIAVAVVIIQLHRYENHLLTFRAQGLTAYHHGDYRTAAHDLSNFLGNDRVDGEAIYAYAVSRSKLPRPDKGNLLDAKRLFNRYLELCPGDVDAEHQLLDIYQKLHYPTETMDTAGDLLKQNPDDVPALAAKLQQLVHDQKLADALPISMRLNELTPYDARTQETTFDLMARTGKRPSEILDRGNQLLLAHPDDPRFELVRALAAYFTSDLLDTKAWLRKASTRTPPDGDFTLLLVGSFDHLGMWDDSRSLLERTATQPSASASLKAKFVQRLWESGQFDTALAVLNGVSPSDSATDSQLLGLDALVLHSLDRSAATLRYALGHRPDDPTAAAWLLLLDVISNSNHHDALQGIQKCQTAEKLDPDNPDVRFYLAQQYLQIGEGELALQCLRQTEAMQPEWSEPYVMIAQILLDRGQIGEAIAPAQAACNRDSDSIPANRMLALVGYQRLDPRAQPIEIKPVLDFIQQVRKTDPTDPKLLAANVDLLARSNSRDAARMLVNVAMTNSTTVLNELAAVDRADELGTTKLLTDRAMTCTAATPSQALDQVRVFATAGDIPTGAKFAAAMQSHLTTDWRLAWLQAREILHDDGVATAWQQFADAQPHDLDVQMAAMRSPTVNANRALMDRTINRMKLLSSDDAIEWKLARAVWQLGATKDVKNSANAAAASMAEVARQEPKYGRPQIIWSQALEQLADINGAIAHLRVAAQLDPEDGQIKAKIAKLETEMTPADDAAAELQRIHEIKPPPAIN